MRFARSLLLLEGLQLNAVSGSFVPDRQLHVELSTEAFDLRLHDPGLSAGYQRSSRLATLRCEKT